MSEKTYSPPVEVKGNPLAADLRSLRQESLRILLLGTSAFAFLWLLYPVLILNDGSPNLVFIPLGLMTVCPASFWLADRRPFLASVAFPCALLLIALLYLWLWPTPLYGFLLVPVILTASVLHSRRGMIGFTLFSCVALVAIAQVRMGYVHSGYRLAVVFCLFTALTAWLGTHNLYIALDWAMKNHSQARQSMEALRERKAALLRLSDALRRNQERMHYLNIRLEHARLAAEEAFHAKRNFVANVSHELRTPLNLITGFSEMMAFSPESYAGVRLPPQYHQDTLEIYRSSKHLLGLVEDVLALAQLEAGRMRVEREWVDLSTVIHDAVETMQPLITDKGLSLDLSIDAELPPVKVDAGRIRQVLLNLLNNASRFTDEGGIAVGVHRQGDDAIIGVQDTGVGIAPEDLPHIFDEFHDLIRGPTGRRGGFGLGLSISQRLVKAHGGKLWATSEPGEGSCFKVSLPLSSPDDTLPRAGMVRSGTESRLVQPRPVVLVISDEDSSDQMLERYLGGYTVINVVPEEVVGAVERYLPACVLVDEKLADTELQDYLMLIMRQAPSLPVITCGIPTGGHVAHQLGADYFLSKPVDRERVVRLLSHLARQSPIRNALIIDDDARMVKMLERMIASIKLWPLQVITACGGQEGLDLLASHRPDVVLLDLAMPDISGYDILEVLAREPEYEDTRVILMTGVDIDQWVGPVHAIAAESYGGFSLAKSLRVVNLMVEEFSGRSRKT